MKMKKIFIPAYVEVSQEIFQNLIEQNIERLPGKIGLVWVVQHEKDIDFVKRCLENAGKSVIKCGSILGCDVGCAETVADRVDAFLYVGSGRFHPIGVFLNTGKRVFVLNPIGKSFYVIDENNESVRDFERKKIAAVKRFYASDVVGIITSIKPGQCRIEEAEKMKEKVEAMGKKAYLFIGDEISEIEKENFPFIQSWINCACPRLSDFRSDMINLAELEKL